MTKFIEVEIRKPEPVAWLRDYGYFGINKKSLQVRIENLKKDGLSTSEEEKALEALEETMLE